MFLFDFLTLNNQGGGQNVPLRIEKYLSATEILIGRTPGPKFKCVICLEISLRRLVNVNYELAQNSPFDQRSP